MKAVRDHGANLTDLERRAGSNPLLVNLTDGHARMQTVDQLDALMNVFRYAPLDFEPAHADAYADEFFALAGQSFGAVDPAPSFARASSLSVIFAARALHDAGCRRLAAIHPTFDNIVGLTRDAGIELVPVASQRFWGNGISDALLNTVDGVFFVTPNNPDGVEPTPKQFETLMNRCRDKFVIGDFSFRQHSPTMDTWDQYQIVAESGAQAVLIEDTGKAWQTQELKIGMSSVSPALRSAFDRHTSMLDEGRELPLAIAMLRALIEVDRRARSTQAPTAFEATIATNQAILREQLKSTAIKVVSPANLGVAWLRLPSSWDADEFCAAAVANGVAVLPGGHFFWDDHSQGSHFVRVALARDPSELVRGAERLKMAALDFVPTPVSAPELG